MDVEKWVSNFEKFADHNNKKQNTVRGQFLLNHIDASSRLVLTHINKTSSETISQQETQKIMRMK